MLTGEQVAELRRLADENHLAALAEHLNEHLRRGTKNLGDVLQLTRLGEGYDVRLMSKRARYGGKRELFAFTGPTVEDPEGGMKWSLDPEATRLHYLYDDTENSGSCEATNLWKVARFR